MRRLVVALAFGPLVVVFCSPPDLGTDRAEPACRTYANTLCTATQNCSAAMFNLRWPSFAACTDYTTIACINSVIAPSSGQTVAYVQGCTGTLMSSVGTTWACGDFLSNVNFPTACVPASGSLPNGAVCAKGPQCQSGYCDVAPGNTCGTCAAVPTPGTPCVPQQFCGYGAYCNDQSVCTDHALLNASCSSHQTCNAGYGCVANTCVAGQTAVGAPCGLGGPNQGCSNVAGLDCNYQTQSCQPMQIVAVGQSCGTVLFGQQTTHCGGGAQCVNNTCQPTAGLGQPCDVVAGPFCIGVAHCITQTDGGTAGTCMITDATSCTN